MITQIPPQCVPDVSLFAEARFEEGVPWLPLAVGRGAGARVQPQDDRLVAADGVGDVLAVGVVHAGVRVVQVRDVAVDAVTGGRLICCQAKVSNLSRTYFVGIVSLKTIHT